MLNKKTTSQLTAESIEILARGETITNFSIGSNVRTILEVINQQLGEFYDALDLNMSMAFISTASDVYLDMIGSLFGVSRTTSETATASAEDRAVKFFVSSGSLAIAIPSKVIPAGTIITTDDANISYIVTRPAPIDDVQSEIYVDVVCTSPGETGNIGSNRLTTHNMSVSNVLVSNPKAILTGTNIESDDNFRYRVINAGRIAATSNITAIRLAALSVPDVANAIITEYVNGVGTFDVLLIPTGNIVSQTTIRRVAALVDFSKAVGMVASIRTPSYVPVEFVIQLEFYETATAVDKNAIKGNVPATILDYIDDIPLGGTFIYTELIRRVKSVDARIKDLKVLCYYFKGRSQLLKNYQLEPDELFIPDPDVANPIRIIT